MFIRLSGVLTLAAFLVVFWILIEATGSSADLVVRGLIWSAVGLASVYAVVRLVRGQPHTTDMTAGLPAAIRRWLVGESRQG